MNFNCQHFSKIVFQSSGEDKICDIVILMLPAKFSTDPIINVERNSFWNVKKKRIFRYHDRKLCCVKSSYKWVLHWAPFRDNCGSNSQIDISETFQWRRKISLNSSRKRPKIRLNYDSSYEDRGGLLWGLYEGVWALLVECSTSNRTEFIL